MQLINEAMIKEPLNWAIIFVIASLWLLLLHVIMTHYTSYKQMQTASN